MYSGDVLFAISEQSRHKVSQKKRSYGSIPYRNSKLTHFMKESFGGNAVVKIFHFSFWNHISQFLFLYIYFFSLFNMINRVLFL